MKREEKKRKVKKRKEKKRKERQNREKMSYTLFLLSSVQGQKLGYLHRTRTNARVFVCVSVHLSISLSVSAVTCVCREVFELYLCRFSAVFTFRFSVVLQTCLHM